jgi:hypothetical protein
MSFIQFGTDDSVISSELITSPLWTNNNYASTASFTSSLQQSSKSGKTYLNIYNIDTTITGSEVQYSIAYGHVSGSGSALFNSYVQGNSPTRDVYGQYRNLIYGDENTYFTFGSNLVSRDILVINVNRSKYKESINPGSWNLVLSGSVPITLTDNSKDVSVTSFIAGNKVYNIVSGSLGSSYNGQTVQTNSGSYGLFFPDMGFLVLNPRALALSSANGGISLSVDETSANTYSDTYNKSLHYFYLAINKGSYFSGRSQETISSRYFFVNAKSPQFNYTTNPSIIDNNGNILYSVLIDSPQVYPTTIGLYNDFGELLAVAKLSKPLPKDFTKQLTCRVKLEF